MEAKGYEIKNAGFGENSRKDIKERINLAILHLFQSVV